MLTPWRIIAGWKYKHTNYTEIHILMHHDGENSRNGALVLQTNIFYLLHFVVYLVSTYWVWVETRNVCRGESRMLVRVSVCVK